MVIDSSAALAILLGEIEDAAFAGAIDADPTRIMSAVSVLESSIVIEARKGPAGGRELDLLLHRGRIDVVPFMPTSWSWRGTPIAATAEAIISPRSISAIAVPMRLPQPRASPFSSKATTSAGRTSSS